MASMTLYFSLFRELSRQRANTARLDRAAEGSRSLNAKKGAEGRGSEATTESMDGSAGAPRSGASGRGDTCGSEMGERDCEGTMEAGSHDISSDSALKNTQKAGQKKVMEHTVTGCTAAPSSQIDGTNPSMMKRVTFGPPAKDKGKERVANLIENKQGCSMIFEKTLGNKTDDSEGNATMQVCKTRCIALSSAKKSQNYAGTSASNGAKNFPDTQTTPSSTPAEEGTAHDPNHRDMVMLSSRPSALNKANSLTHKEASAKGLVPPSGEQLERLVVKGFDKQRQFYERRLRAERAAGAALRNEVKEGRDHLERLRGQREAERETQEAIMNRKKEENRRLRTQLEADRKATAATIRGMKEDQEQLRRNLNAERDSSKENRALFMSLQKLL